MSVAHRIVGSVRGWQKGASAVSRHIADMGAVLAGLYEYKRTGDVSPERRRSLLNLHCRTNGNFTDRLATLVRAMRPPRKAGAVAGVLGNLSVEMQEGIVADLARDGYYVFDKRLSQQLCDEIAVFASRTPCAVEGLGARRAERVQFNPDRPISKTYRIVESDVVANHAVHHLMADQSLLAIAEMYLKTLPILSMMNLWWSATFGDRPGADAAQEFHFDFDPPPIWLLFFIYLTDVAPENGPHVFVRGSHAAGHAAAGPLLARGYARISDEEIEEAFGRENVIELCGKRGTIMAVDTRGFHKGKMLTCGHRLMMQLTYSCPPYSGAHGRKVELPDDIDPRLREAISKAPRVYERYL
jgi:hypothetical protein